MTRDELHEFYRAMKNAQAKVDHYRGMPASFEADLASRKANREWDAAIIAYNKAFDEYLAQNPEAA
jgi:hypothetical protein